MKNVFVESEVEEVIIHIYPGFRISPDDILCFLNQNRCLKSSI